MYYYYYYYSYLIIIIIHLVIIIIIIILIITFNTTFRHTIWFKWICNRFFLSSYHHILNLSSIDAWVLNMRTVRSMHIVCVAQVVFC